MANKRNAVTTPTEVFGVLRATRSLTPKLYMATPRSPSHVRIYAQGNIESTLFTRVGEAAAVAGYGTFILPDWKLVRMTALEILPYDPDAAGTIADTLKALHAASRGRRDGIDVDAFVREMRGDD